MINLDVKKYRNILEDDLEQALTEAYNDGFNRALQELAKTDIHLEYDLPRILRQTMEKNGMQNADMAAKTGISQSAIHHYIHGTRTPSAKNLYMMAEALGVTADYLLTGGARLEEQSNEDKL